MNTDEKIDLARRLAQHLRVRRTEWEKCAQYAGRYGVDKAIQLAQHMAHSPSLRDQPRGAAQSIGKTVRRYYEQLFRLSLEDLREVLGYVGRFLVINERNNHAQGTARHTGRNTRRRH